MRDSTRKVVAAWPLLLSVACARPPVVGRDAQVDGREPQADLSDQSAPVDIRAFRPVVSPSGWRWRNPLPQGNTLMATWSFSSRDVWMAGQRGTLLHFDGGAWARVESATTRNLRALWASSPTRIWAVGEAGTILAYDGSRWSATSLEENTDLKTVWGFSASDVWAGGTDAELQTATIYHFDGRQWSLAYKHQHQEATFATVNSIWGASPTDVWAVGVDGRGSVLHFDGTAWTSQPLQVTARGGSFDGVWGASAGDIWVVGSWGNLLHFGKTTGWTIVPSPTSKDLHSIWGTSPTDVWAAAGACNELPCTEVGELLHFDGTGWSRVFSSTTRHLWDVKGASASDIWAVGTGGTMVHFDGKAWVQVTRGGQPAHLHGVWGGSPTDLWAVGADWAGSAGALLHFDGHAWSDQSSVATSPLYGVWGNGPSDVWAVGDGDSTLHYDGGKWTRTTVDPAGRRGLRAVWGTSSKDVWAVGSGGTILHHEGSQWSVVPPPAEAATAELTGIWGSRTDDVWVVGSGQTLHYDGKIWSSQAATGRLQMAISGCATDDVWAVGYADQAAAVFHYDGKAWSTGYVLSGITEPGGVYCRSAGDVWTSGWSQSGSVIFHYDGTSWTPQDPESANPVTALWAAAADDVWAIGDNGTALHYKEPQ